MSAGIDYGLGRTNIDLTTGIRFGVISQHSISQAWADSSEADYGKPTCPKCSNDVFVCGDYSHNTEGWPRLYSHGCEDYGCESCEHILDSSDVFGDELLGWSVDDGEYKMVDCLDSAVMVLWSPYYTFAPFCSPCVPGAGNLDGANNGAIITSLEASKGGNLPGVTEDDRYALLQSRGVKTYCVGHDWFENGRAPYPVFSIATGEEVQP